MTLTAQQLATRQTYIGASDVGALLGLDQYRQPMQVYLEKRGELEPQPTDSEAALWGKLHEDTIAREYARRTGYKVYRDNRDYQLLDGRFQGHIDRRIVGLNHKRGMEAKTVGLRVSHYWGEPETDQIYEPYLAQCHSYLLLTDSEVWDVPALFGGNEMRIYRVERDPAWDQIILNAVTDFWRRVDEGDPPAMDYGHRSTPALQRALYPGTNGARVELPEDAEHWSHVLRTCQEQAKALNTTIDVAKARITEMMADAAVGYLPNGGGFKRSLTKAAHIEFDREAFISLRYSGNIKRT